MVEVASNIYIQEFTAFLSSRDTSIKIWDLKKGKLVHNFGGHTSSITCIRFWSLKFYKLCLQNILNSDDNEDEEGIYLNS